MFANKNKGFTLIELLVVIAIIGILSSVVLASLNSARKKSRDARRIGDMKQLQLALEMYFDTSGEYPSTASGTAALQPTYIPSVPEDPQGNSYVYASTADGYCLGITLENEHNALDNTASDCSSSLVGITCDQANKGYCIKP